MRKLIDRLRRVYAYLRGREPIVALNAVVAGLAWLANEVSASVSSEASWSAIGAAALAAVGRWLVAPHVKEH